MVRHKYNKYCGIFALTTICAYTLSFLPAIADDVIQNEENNNNNNNKSYTLVETTESDKSQNVIVKYEYNKETGLLTPKYYKVNLIKTTYGNENGTKTISIDTPYSVSGNITYKYNPIDTTTPSNERLENTTDNSDKTTTGNFFNLNSDTITQGGAINNTGLLGDINSSFQNNSLNLENLSETVQGGAIYNDTNATLGNITGDFIQNSITNNNVTDTKKAYSYAQGGAISNKGIMGDITGNFIENSVTSSADTTYNSTSYSTKSDIYAYAKGGAIYNEANASIDNITGDFVGNKVTADLSDKTNSSYRYLYSYAYGGAIHNDGLIINIEGNFINNSAEALSPDTDYSYGGAIYNSGLIGNISGDFIANNSSDRGGAIYNDNEITNITGSFINNTASLGAAIYNNGQIDKISGDFIANSSENSGGAIYNNNEINDIAGNFIGNSSGYYGGAIYNGYKSKIDSIKSDFISNYIYKITSYVYGGISLFGGAIYNSGEIADITAGFVDNSIYASVSNPDNGDVLVFGAAICNEGNIDGIKADFIKNEAYSYAGALLNNTFGGALYNSGNIGDITGNFIQNQANADGVNASASGGAIYNSGNNATIAEITGNFIENQVNTGGGSAYGGAIYQDYNPNNNIDYRAEQIIINKNDGTVIKLTNADDEFKNAVSEGKNVSLSTYTYTEDYILSISNNKYSTVEEYIAANYSEYIEGDINEFYEENKQDKDYYDLSSTIVNSSFINNSAIANGYSADAKGGAIYSTNDVKIIAKDGYHSLISGNYTETNSIKDENAIHLSTRKYYDSISNNNYDVEGRSSEYKYIYYIDPASLTLEANTNGIIQIDDKISGEKGGMIYETTSYYDDPNDRIIIKEADENYKIYVTGDNTGTVIFNNDVEGEADMYLYQTTLKLGKRDDVLKNNNMTFNSGTFDMVNNQIGSTNFNTLTLNNTIQTMADVNLQQETMDRITADNYIVNNENNPNINVTYLNLLNDTTKDSVSILYADKEIANNVQYKGDNPISVDEKNVAYTPIYKYDVSYQINDNDDMGYFVFNRGNINDSNSYNPSVLAPSVSSQAGAYTTQLQTLEYAFKHSDAFMALPSFERMAIINADRYALTPTSDATDIGTFSPLMTKLDVSGFWVKPYTSFESIPLDNGPKVSNISYGTLVGYDSNLKHLKNGWERVLTGYIGYNGASQRYSGIDTYQNGGILGLTTTFYKNNFFNATTISTGATVGNSSTYYGDEDYTMLTAGIGNKFGYNFEFKDGKFILQPNLLLSYTFINTFDYTNASGLKIKSDPLHALQIAPGIKFIMNTESGWQPYLRADMIWNILDKTKVTANDVRLPEMSIDPYVQYGIGVQKLFKNERLTFFGQALVQNGGRNGVSLNAGLRWAVGRGE